MSMSGNKILLDTSIIIEVLNGNKKIADKLNDLKEFSISSVVLGELFVGINRVANKQKHFKILNDFINLSTIVDVDKDTAVCYGELMASLYKKGKPIPTNDIWIAAIAKQHDFTLITQDKHFKEIGDIRIKFW